ncbi:PIN domain-containing protein [Thermococcus thermotolerans]|uniref:PIN domain-containing protein n=1 Tax=Thermococcus thermotolerans TaxID=2969672 RepID=UPI00215812C2|nr:PIN domain-containing protein [Thermococcus thermotolerans]
MIYIDTSVLYHYTTNGEFADFAEDILTSKEPKVTSDTVVDEFLFIAIKREVRRNFGINSTLSLKKRIAKNDELLEFVYETGKRALAVLDRFDIMIVPDSRDWAKILVLMKFYKLLPHDARIIATALEYGAKKVATFDTDFGVAKEIVELTPSSFWNTIQF